MPLYGRSNGQERKQNARNGGLDPDVNYVGINDDNDEDNDDDEEFDNAMLQQPQWHGAPSNERDELTRFFHEFNHKEKNLFCEPNPKLPGKSNSVGWICDQVFFCITNFMFFIFA